MKYTPKWGSKNDGPEIHAPMYFIFPNPEWDEEFYDPRPFLELNVNGKQ